MQVQQRIAAFLSVRMVKSSISNAKYTYVHDQKYPPEAVDIHHIVFRKSGAKNLFVYILALLVLACAFYLYVLKVCIPTIKLFKSRTWIHVCAFQVLGFSVLFLYFNIICKLNFCACIAKFPLVLNCLAVGMLGTWTPSWTRVSQKKKNKRTFNQINVILVTNVIQLFKVWHATN